MTTTTTHPRSDRATSPPLLLEKEAALFAQLAEAGRVMVAFSGGVDSSYLGWAAHRALGSDCLLVTAVSPSHPSSHRVMAEQIVLGFGLPHRFVETNEMASAAYRANAPDRCYHCKSELFETMDDLGRELGFDRIAYGVNTDDSADFRPGHRAADEHHVMSPLREADLSGIAGSGAGGRLTIQDFEKFLSQLEQSRLTQASSMRVAVADAMRRSWTRPLATVGRPVRLDAMLAHRSKMAPKPGPALFAIRALAIALSENSATAGRLIGNKIAHPASIDIGFAVEAEDGVLVPVIRHADKTSVQGMVSTYKELVASARQRKLPPNATGGSIATVTNFGTFGLTWATPIPLPEQTLVLGLGAGRKVPFWDTEQGCFVPITESQMTLSFDHRVLDGGAAGRLLTRVDALMANPESL